MAPFSTLPMTPPVTRSQSPHQASSAAPIAQRPHTLQLLDAQRKLQALKLGTTVILDGNSLDVPDVVAVAQYGTEAALSKDPEIRTQIDKSVATLDKLLKQGRLVYGVTTGFGGSADTRTADVSSLQRALIQHQQSGVLTSQDIQSTTSPDSTTDRLAYSGGLQHDTQSMPTSWVKASMLTRTNSIIRGHSGVRSAVAETILALLRHDITPVVPLRGSISASGDLSPLSYIAGAIEGHPNIFVRCGKSQAVMTAKNALAEYGIEPVVLRAKEGLGLLNGTAFSAATAALAISQAQDIAIMSQILTAMGVEAMQGSSESFHPKIAEMRPHLGQVESAANILAFLSDSKLASGLATHGNLKLDGLAQDRYALRTSSQWIGPQLEDLHRAQQQLIVELNSTTDNPLIDVENEEILHGGNFQAAVVTSAMDRCRLALEKLGRMLFAQSTELINPAMNKGLPPNLCSDDPSLSFTCKGADINMAAYASELGFLANPVGNHVMSAEMHNQSINSLALISSRYTFQALDIVRMLCANYLFVVCQALDLRVLQIEFLTSLKPKTEELVHSLLPHTSSPAAVTDLTDVIWNALTTTWSATTNLDLSIRCIKVAESTISPIIMYFSRQVPDWSSNGISSAITNGNDHDDPHGQLPMIFNLTTLTSFTSSLASLLQSTYSSTRQRMYVSNLSVTPRYLGNAAKAMYIYIRSPPVVAEGPALESSTVKYQPNATGGLGVGFHKGLIEDPLQPLPSGTSRNDIGGTSDILVGSRISRIYEALRDGMMSDVILDILTTVISGEATANGHVDTDNVWNTNGNGHVGADTDTNSDASSETVVVTNSVALAAAGKMTSIGMTTSIGIDDTTGKRLDTNGIPNATPESTLLESSHLLNGSNDMMKTAE